MKQHKTKQNKIKNNETKQDQTEWNKMKQNEIKWNQRKPNETKWNQMKPKETQWNKMHLVFSPGGVCQVASSPPPEWEGGVSESPAISHLSSTFRGGGDS
jgi:hypothetical protein